MADIEIGMSVIKSMAHEIAQEVLGEINKENPEIKERIESYDDGYEQGKLDGVREFVEWFDKEYSVYQECYDSGMCGYCEVKVSSTLRRFMEQK